MYIPDIPNNNLKPQLEELVYIASKIDTEVSEDDKYSLIFDFNASATEEEIKKLEKEIDTSLPIGYKEFLFFSNGAQLCGHYAEFSNTARVAKINKLKKTPDFPEDYIIIAKIIGDGEILCFSKETGKIIRYYDGREITFDDFYLAFRWLLELIRNSAEEYVDL